MWCSGLGEVTLAETRLNKKASSLWPRRGQTTKTTCANTFRQGCLRQAQGTTHWTTCGSQPLLCYRRFWMGGGKAPGKASVPPPAGAQKTKGQARPPGTRAPRGMFGWGGRGPRKKVPPSPAWAKEKRSCSFTHASDRMGCGVHACGGDFLVFFIQQYNTRASTPTNKKRSSRGQESCN